MSLRTRLAIVTSLLVVLGVTITGAASWVSTRAELTDQVDDFLSTRSEQIATELGDLRRDEQPMPLPNERGIVFQRLNRAGVVLATSSGNHQNKVDQLPVSDNDIEIAQNGGTSRIRRVKVDGAELRLITRHIDGGRDGRGAIQVAAYMDDTRTALAGLLSRILLIGAVLTLLAAAAGWLVARSTTRPLRRLTATAEEVSATQDLTTSIDVERSDEVGSLAMSFRSMLDALRRSREQQQRLIQDAAHEVRTPLTTLRANIELLERAPDIGEPHRSELLGSLRSEFEALTNLFNEVVELAIGERDEAPFDSLDLNDPADRAARIFTSRTGRTLHTTWEGDTIDGNAELLERAIGNLLHNAHKYSPTDQPVELEVRGRRVVVRDHGPGIPADERELVFDRFYRSDEARAMSGSGLGLAIVKQIVERHGGTVFVGDAPGGGAEVGFQL